MNDDAATVEGTTSKQRWSDWLAAATLLLAILGMAVSSPPFVGPDERAHQATASYLTVEILPPVSETRDYVSGMLDFGDCAFVFDQTKDAGCIPSRDNVRATKDRILNYPPLYYWAIGLGQKAAPGADEWMDVGGRAASAVLNAAALILLALLLFRRVNGWGSILLAVSTPMAVFLWAVVNPNGWEVTAGMLFAYFFARAWWHSDLLGAYRSRWVPVVTVAASAIVFALSRHDALVWLTMVALGVLVMARSPLSRPSRAAVVGAAALGPIMGLLWQVTHPAQHTDNNPDRLADPSVMDYLHWLGQIDAILPDRLRQMVGVLGWLDTPVPQWLVLTMIVGWASVFGFLYSRTRIPAAVPLVGFAGLVVVPALLEVNRWNDWPYWYQGRITLSFAIPFLFVLLLRFGARGTRPIAVLSMLTALALAIMVWLNLARYSFGTQDYWPLRWSDPAIGGPAFWIGVACVAGILSMSALRSWWLVGERSSWLRAERKAHSAVGS